MTEVELATDVTRFPPGTNDVERTVPAPSRQNKIPSASLIAISPVTKLDGVFVAVVATTLVGGVYALVLLALHGYFTETVKRYGAILKTFIYTGRFIYIPPENVEKRPALAYGVAIALGTIISVLRGHYSITL